MATMNIVVYVVVVGADSDIAATLGQALEGSPVLEAIRNAKPKKVAPSGKKKARKVKPATARKPEVIIPKAPRAEPEKAKAGTASVRNSNRKGAM